MRQRVTSFVLVFLVGALVGGAARSRATSEPISRESGTISVTRASAPTGVEQWSLRTYRISRADGQGELAEVEGAEVTGVEWIIEVGGLRYRCWQRPAAP